MRVPLVTFRVDRALDQLYRSTEMFEMRLPDYVERWGRLNTTFQQRRLLKGTKLAGHTQQDSYILGLHIHAYRGIASILFGWMNA